MATEQTSLDLNNLSAQIQAALAAYKHQIAQIKTNKSFTWGNTIQPLEEAAEKLDRFWNVLEHENAVRNTPQVRAEYEKLLPILTDFHTDVLQDEELYKIYLGIKNDHNFAQLTSAQKSIINKALEGFELGGIKLPSKERTEFKELHQRLISLENNFSNNVLDSTESWTYHVTTSQKDLLDGIPEHAINLAKNKAQEQNKTGWIFTLDYPCFIAIMAHANNRQLREEFHIAYYTRASNQGPLAGKLDNTPIIAEILKIRQQLARLIGLNNFAEYSLIPKMAQDVAQVKEFLMSLVAKAKPQGKREFKELCEFAKQQGFAQELAPWDLMYFTEKMRKAKYDISEEELRPYFPEPIVLQGLFKLAKKLFGINITEEFDFASWHDSVRMFKVVDQDNKLRGHFYIDLYTREGKRGGAWMAECISRIRFANGALQTPIAYLNCNFAPPETNKPGLFTHQDVITLFHEFGHTIHHVLTQVDYFSAAGLNGVEWDAVELPSQFMENWAWEWDIVKEISKNIDTGEHLPKATFDRLLESKNFQSAMFLLRQLEFSIFDLRIHENAPEDQNRSAHDILQEVRKQTAVVPISPLNRFENSFSHIFAGGYAAGYYSYLWAEVLSCDAFDKFISSNDLHADLGKQFMVKILEKGSSMPAMDLFVAFAGRKPEVDALLKHHAIN